MQYKIFSIPICGGEEMTEEMNKFLRSCRIINVERRLVENVHSASWCFCIEYMDSQANSSVWQKKEKVDYKTVLDEETFKVFARLREIRKRIADEDAVPAYAVFTDAELADIASLPVKNGNSLLKIEGIGKKKVEKYGEMLCRLLNDNSSEE